MPLYAITDSQSRALTHSEVFGRPIVGGEFEYLGAKWPWPSVGVNKKRDTEFDVLAAKTSILKTLFSGATPEMKELIRITAKLPGEGHAKLPGEGRAGDLTDEEMIEVRRIRQERLDAKQRDAEEGGELKPAIAESTSQPPDQTEACLNYPAGMIIVSLAQVIDCRLPENDSYQAIVMQLVKSFDDEPITITSRRPESASGLRPTAGSVSHVRSFELLVKFTRYDSVPIVRAFGLFAKPPIQGPDATIETVAACSHGWIDTPVEENGSINFAWRLGASDWEYPQDDWQKKLELLDPAIEKKMQDLREFIAKF